MRDRFERVFKQIDEVRKNRYLRIISKFNGIELNEEEKEHLLWLCGWDNDTEKVFTRIFEKFRSSKEALEKQVPYKLTQIDKEALTGICKCGRITDFIDGEYYCKYCGQKIIK